MTKSEEMARAARTDEMPQLKALWQTVFGDDTADIDHFFETWFSPDMTVVIGDDEKLMAAAYILPVGPLVLQAHCDKDEKKAGAHYNCAMLYGIATRPDCRGRGFGAAVTNAALAAANKKGYDAVVLKPADDGLFGFYEKHTPFREFFTAVETEWQTGALACPNDGLILSAVSPERYQQIRRNYLSGADYIDMDIRALSYQQHLCRKSDGGLFELSRHGRPSGCAVIERGGGTVHIKELLLSDDCRLQSAVSAVSALFLAQRYITRTVSADSIKIVQKRRFGMLAPIDTRPGNVSVQTAKWYGLAFD